MGNRGGPGDEVCVGNIYTLQESLRVFFRVLPESVIAIAFGRPKHEFPREERRADGLSNF